MDLNPQPQISSHNHLTRAPPLLYLPLFFRQDFLSAFTLQILLFNPGWIRGLVRRPDCIFGHGWQGTSLQKLPRRQRASKAAGKFRFRGQRQIL